jgi:hypothetical protein
MILELDQMQLRLDAMFIPLEPMLTGFRLLPSQLTIDVTESIEKSLALRLPKQFVSLVQQFDFGTLTIGPTVFCHSGDFPSWILENNLTELTCGYSWWGSGERPSNTLFIADSDYYTILLNCETGNVFAFNQDQQWSEAIPVADNFELFVRAVGTVFLERKESGGNALLAESVSIEVGGGQDNRYWQWLAA